jgi:GT2 family glycosyltransferase
MDKVSVVIVLYNEFELVKTCLASVYVEDKNLEVILVDNSTDKLGHKKVLAKFPKVRYIQNKNDLGFGPAVNVGIKRTKGEFILVLTPDMYILPETIKASVKYLVEHKEAGLVGCRVFSKPGVQEPSVLSFYPGIISQIYYYNIPFYKLVRRFFKNFNPMYFSKAEHRKQKNAKAVSGQSMMIRKKAAAQVGYFDSRFFLYFEDIDLCKRLNENGWKVVYLPTGGVVQNGISGWKQKVRITQSFPDYMKSLYIFFKKHNGLTYARVAWLLGTVSAVISIPYLLITSIIKKMLGFSSQSSELLPIWTKIAKWHIEEGVKEVF